MSPEADFNPDFGVPPDPAYVKFEEGLRRAIEERGLARSFRWSPSHAQWAHYSGSWLLGEIDGNPKTAPTMVMSLGTPAEYLGTGLTAGRLFRELNEKNAALRRSWPHARFVWTPWDGGAWRRAFDTSVNPPDRDPGKPKPPPPGLDRIERVKEYWRLGHITWDEAQRQINEIVAEYT